MGVWGIWGKLCIGGRGNWGIAVVLGGGDGMQISAIVASQGLLRVYCWRLGVASICYDMTSMLSGIGAVRGACGRSQPISLCFLSCGQACLETLTSVSRLTALIFKIVIRLLLLHLLQEPARGQGGNLPAVQRRAGAGGAGLRLHPRLSKASHWVQEHFGAAFLLHVRPPAGQSAAADFQSMRCGGGAAGAGGLPGKGSEQPWSDVGHGAGLLQGAVQAAVPTCRLLAHKRRTRSFLFATGTSKFAKASQWKSSVNMSCRCDLGIAVLCINAAFSL